MSYEECLLSDSSNAHPITRWPVLAMYSLTNLWDVAVGSSILTIQAVLILNWASAKFSVALDSVRKLCGRGVGARHWAGDTLHVPRG